MVISDEDSARAWLKTQSHPALVAFSARAALRVLPRMGDESKNEILKLLWRVFRSMIISTVAAAEVLDGEEDFLNSAFYSTAADTWSAFADSVFSAHYSTLGEGNPEIAAVVLSSSVLLRAAGYDDDADTETVDWSELAYRQANSDAKFLENNHPAQLFDQPLWSRVPMPLALANSYDKLTAYHSSKSEDWGDFLAFFLEWYSGMVDGQPLPWELQRRVALIDQAIWETGHEAIAKEIEKIRAKFNLEKRVEELEAELRSATLNRHGIGGNMPPELLHDAPVAQELGIVRQPVQDLKVEIAKDHPDPKRLQEIIEALATALKRASLGV
ncbi:hypothetical protein [Leisingera sp. MMG026]|uniref:hypothetical protein n=1 Tax=Leisingera sp. MMG026 TaxID=2909982 RepID=UPI001F1687DC|nr:hypothetical protein [Leisingera sp. MMG026]MCF6433678.1 hypothetical protein [Leisingera sp. MMG026]